MKKILLSLSLAIVSLFAVSQVDVRSSLKGSVTDSSGPVSGAEVVVVFTPTGSTDRAVTNAAGAFVVNNLAPVALIQVLYQRLAMLKQKQWMFSQNLVKHLMLVSSWQLSLKRLWLLHKL